MYEGFAQEFNEKVVNVRPLEGDEPYSDSAHEWAQHIVRCIPSFSNEMLDVMTSINPSHGSWSRDVVEAATVELMERALKLDVV